VVSKHCFIAYPTDGSGAIFFMQNRIFFMHIESFAFMLRLMMKASCRGGLGTHSNLR